MCFSFTAYFLGTICSFDTCIKKTGSVKYAYRTGFYSLSCQQQSAVMMVYFKAHVISKSFFQNVRHIRLIKCHMMLVSIFTDMLHHPLKVFHLAVSYSALCWNVVRQEFPFPDITFHLPVFVVGGNLCKGHWAGGNLSLACAKAFLRPNRCGKNIQVFNFKLVSKETGWEIRAMQANALIAVIPNVVVPIHICGRSAGSQI